MTTTNSWWGAIRQWIRQWAKNIEQRWYLYTNGQGDLLDFIWLVLTVVLMLTIITLAEGCGGGGGPTSPEIPVAPIAAMPPMVPPAVLLGSWATPEQAMSRIAEANVVVLRPTWGQDISELARQLRGAGVGAMVYTGFLQNPPSTWDGEWASFERYVKPLRDAGVFVGTHALDEYTHNGVSREHAQKAIDYTRSHGVRDVLVTQWIDDVSSKSRYPEPWPSGVRWHAVSCYDFPSVNWPISYCDYEYGLHPEWDTVVAQGFDAGRGMPSVEKWMAVGGAARGRLWWRDAE